MNALVADLEPRPNDSGGVDEPEVIRPGESPREERFGPPPAGEPKKLGLLARAAIAVTLALAGLVLLLVGVVLTISIVGAAIGIPLGLLGVALLGAAAFVLLAGGGIVVRRF